MKVHVGFVVDKMGLGKTSQITNGKVKKTEFRKQAESKH